MLGFVGRAKFIEKKCLSLAKRLVQCQFINMKVHVGDIKYEKTYFDGRGRVGMMGLCRLLRMFFGCEVVRLEGRDSGMFGCLFACGGGCGVGFGFGELFEGFLRGGWRCLFVERG